MKEEMEEGWRGMKEMEEEENGDGGGGREEEMEEEMAVKTVGQTHGAWQCSGGGEFETGGWWR